MANTFSDVEESNRCELYRKAQALERTNEVGCHEKAEVELRMSRPLYKGKLGLHEDSAQYQTEDHGLNLM